MTPTRRAVALVVLLACLVGVTSGCSSRPHAPAPKWQYTECRDALRTGQAEDDVPACDTLTAKQIDQAKLDAKRWRELHPS